MSEMVKRNYQFREREVEKVGIENRERDGIAISETRHESGSTGTENGLPTGVKPALTESEIVKRDLLILVWKGKRDETRLITHDGPTYPKRSKFD